MEELTQRLTDAIGDHSTADLVDAIASALALRGDGRSVTVEVYEARKTSGPGSVRHYYAAGTCAADENARTELVELIDWMSRRKEHSSE